MSAEDVEICTDPQALQVRRMVNSVRMEIHRMRGFIRLKPLGPWILYGYLKPRHKTGSHICRHFSKRSPSTVIVLGNALESWVSLCIGKDIFQSEGRGLNQSLQELKDLVEITSDGNYIEEAWKVYYSSQYCSQRRNNQHFNRRMPRSSLDSADLKLEKNKNGRTLEDFFEGNWNSPLK
jgi:hypothetical protein